MLPSFQYNEKSSQSDSCIYTLTLNASNEFNSTELVPENFQQLSDPSSKDLVSWTQNEFSSEVKHVYFIVPPEDVQYSENEIKVSSTSLDNIIDSENRALNLKNDSSINFDKITISNNSETIYSGLFDYKVSAPAEIFIENSENINESVSESSNIPSFEDRLSKRDSLLPNRRCSKINKRKIKCDKCKTELISASQYYSHRNIHMQNDDKLSWFCSQCGERMKGRNALKSHELQKHGEIRMYPCPYCVYSSRKLLTLEYHIRNIHHGEKKFNCKLCSKKFFRVHDLKMHLNIHFELKCYTCHLCGKQFNHSSNLIQHLRVHTKVRPYSCHACDRRFSHFPSLLAHQVSHTSGGKCPDCDAKYRSVSGLKKHVKSVHKRKICSKEINKTFYRNSENNFARTRFFNCRVCYERFRYKRGLKIHEQTFHSNGAIPCKSCLNIFPTIQDFKSHACHLSKGIDPVDINSSIYKCSVCLKICKSLEEAESHICESPSNSNISNMKCNNFGITVIPEANENSEETLVLYFGSSDTNSQLCSDVNSIVFKGNSSEEEEKQQHAPMVKEVMTTSVTKKLPSNSKSKRNHKKKNKTNDKNLSQSELNVLQSMTRDSNGATIYKCKYCVKEFTKKWNWSQHMGTHDSSMQKYRCQFCAKSFSYRSTYTNHLKTHSLSSVSGMDTFSCSQCSKTYKSKATLYHHVKRIHENKKNYFCNECSKEFYFKPALEYHMRLHKKELIYVCSFCGKKFSHSSHLHRHERMHTGERPHKCPHCPKSFIQAVTLRTHLRRHQDLSSCMNDAGKMEVLSVSSKEIVVDEPEESQKDFAVINLEEITDLAPVDFSSFVGTDTTLDYRLL